MQIPKSILVALILSSLSVTSTLVQAASDSKGDYQEISYDDLLNELSAKKRAVTKKDTSDLDDVRLHAGVGYANSFTNISAQGQNFNRHAAGIQLSVGMDLFSPQWYSEGVFRNYGSSSSGTEDFTLREIDLKIGYTDKLESIWSYTLSSGLSNRFLKFSDAAKNVSVDTTTPSLVISTGFMGQVHKNLSIGAEFGARSALVNDTADKNSFDFALRLTTSL
jgi:hypothetical protein